MVSLIVIVCLSLVVMLLSYVVYRLFVRLFEFDEVFELLQHDIDVNIKYFDSLADQSLLSNAQEVIEADKNMKIMRDRLKEYVLRIHELPRNQSRSERKKKNTRPKFV